MGFRTATIVQGMALFVFLAGAIAGAALPAFARTETVLYSFCSQTNCTDGNSPMAGVIEDSEGNLYGTTAYGGAYGEGVVFKLSSAGAETVLYSFCSDQEFCSDGAAPTAAVIMDSDGNLYGTTSSGGANGAGTVFKLTSSGEESVLYSFCSQANCEDGAYPDANLIMDGEGNLYSTTPFGGANTSACNSGLGCGTVFKLNSSGVESVLYSFCSQANCEDGDTPFAGLIMDADSNLYGTTASGGVKNDGTIFKLAQAGAETVLHSFGTQSGDGSYPEASLIMDADGNLYGTCYEAGKHHDGTVFKLAASGTETVLYSLTNGKNIGAYPVAGLVMDSNGDLYGASSSGSNNYGVAFELSLSKKGSWTFTALHVFTGVGEDQGDPLGTPILDAKDNLYGTTSPSTIGNNGGTVYKITP
jgi:uncharacterized repeat protein (TIGR03803 family)